MYNSSDSQSEDTGRIDVSDSLHPISAESMDASTTAENSSEASLAKKVAKGAKGASAQELLGAAAVAVVAFVAPQADTGIVLRSIYAVAALAVLLLASVSLALVRN